MSVLLIAIALSPQVSGGHNKYYMRYLSTRSSALGGGRLGADSAEAVADSSTPVATSGRQGDTAHSKAAFETWKSRQQDKLEK